MDISAISAASIGLSMGKVQTNVEVEMLEKVMDLQETLAVDLIQSLETAVPASFGQRLDTYA